MSTITMKINFAKPDTNLYFWQSPSTIDHPYEMQNHCGNSLNSCSSFYRRYLQLLGRLSRSSSLPTYSFLAV